MSNLKQAIKVNYLKCVQDPSYFINQYCTISTPVTSKYWSRKFASNPVVKNEANKATLPME